jgi:hypothetical protein
VKVCEFAAFNGLVTAGAHYTCMPSSQNYAAYLVRWQWEPGQSHWRATAENVHTGEKRQFADRDELLHFLWQALSPVMTPQSGDQPAPLSPPSTPPAR